MGAGYTSEMDWPIVAFAFALGACVGSFLNVVTMRLGHAWPTGRSHCPNCHKTLRVWELVPILSYLVLRGKCARCHKRLSTQYPIVELATALSFAVLAFSLPYTESSYLWAVWFAYGTVVLSLSMAILVYDYQHTIVPDVFVYPLGVLTFAALFFSFDVLPQVPSLWDILAGPIVAFPLAALWVISRGRWIGLGDAKVALAIGWLLGITAGFTALAIAFWAGAIVGITLLGVSRFAAHRMPLTMKSEVPFAPFLIVGAAAAYLTGANFFFVL